MRNLTQALSFRSMTAFAAETGTGSDPLADLGLDLGDAPATDAPVAAADAAGTVENAEAVADGSEGGEATEEKVKQTRTQVKVGEVEFEEFDLIPSIKRGGGGAKGESKYDFDKLSAPVAKDDGSDTYRYSTFTVNNVEGQDFKALARSVQSAATAQNREHKEQGSIVRFITRTKVTDGAAVGVIVFRVDDKVAEEA